MPRAARYPHVEAKPVDPVAIGGRAPRRLDIDDDFAAGFETHWTRILYTDLLGRADAPAHHDAVVETWLNPNEAARAMGLRTGTLASRPLATPQPLPAARHWAADNDPTCEEMRSPVGVPAIADWPVGNDGSDDASSRARALERRARNALATMRLPHTGSEQAAPAAAAARTLAPASVTQSMRHAMAAMVAFARRALARRRQRLQARAICETLGRYDDRTLRDLGLHRSEITSLAAEAAGTAACTRERIHRLRRGSR